MIHAMRKPSQGQDARKTAVFKGWHSREERQAGSQRGIARPGPNALILKSRGERNNSSVPEALRTPLTNRQKRVDVIPTEFPDAGFVLAKDLLNLRSGAVAAANPDHLGWKPEKETPLMKVRILRYDNKVVSTGKFPDNSIICIAQADEAHMRRTGIRGLKRSHQPRREVLIKEKFHEGIVTSLRSRSAAKARQALRSSAVRSGKSARISASVIPEAR